MPASQRYSVHLERLLPVAPLQVFEAWTKPKLLMQWIAPAGMQAWVRDASARPGGPLRIEFEGGPDQGDQGYSVQAQYREVEDTGIVLSWDRGAEPWPEAATVRARFTPTKGGTLVDLEVQGLPDAATAASDEALWTQRLASLQRLANK